MSNIAVSNQSILSVTGKTTDQTSSVIDLRNAKGFAIMAVVTETTPTAGGSIQVQMSVDGVTYFTISSTSISGTTSVGVNTSDVMYDYARVFFDITGGTVSIDCNASVGA